jgi:hypothetical protein
MLNILPRSLASSTKDALTLASEAGVVKQRWSLGQGMQDVDGPSQVQPLAEPTRARRPRSEAKAMRGVAGAECRDGISGHHGRCRHLGQRVSIGPSELERPVGPARDLEALLVHRAMMPATEQREV